MLDPLPQYQPQPVPRRFDERPLPFECSWSTDGMASAWVHLAGELDLWSTPVLTQLLREAPLQARLVVIDLRELAFIDTTGLHAIIDASVKAHERGDRIVLLRGPAKVDRMFALTEETHDLEIIDLSPVEPPVQALLHIAEDLAS